MIDVGGLTWVDLRKGGAMQIRICGALMMREVRTRFGHSKFGYAWALIEPMIQIGILVIIFTMIGRRPPLGTSYESFFLNGYFPFAMFSQISNRAATAITANRALLSFPPVRNMDTVWSRIVLETAASWTSFLMLVAIFAFFSIPVVPHDFIQYLLGFFAVVSLATGMGLFNASLSTLWGSWLTVYSWITRIQYFLCGIFFLPDLMPPMVREYLYWNPLTHCIIWVREGFYVGYESIVLDRAYPFLVAVVLSLLGLGIERVLRRQVDKI